MTLDEVKAFVAAEAGDCPIHWFPGSRVAECGGVIQVMLQVKIGRHSAGRYQRSESILLDEEVPPDELAGIFLHEMGHRRYSLTVPQSQWDDADSEVAADRYALSELIRRDMTPVMQHYLHNHRTWLKCNRAESPMREAAILRLMESEEWRRAAEICDAAPPIALRQPQSESKPTRE
jgi:hypothetical protein